jgi:hypothetical protein
VPDDPFYAIPEGRTPAVLSLMSVPHMLAFLLGGCTASSLIYKMHRTLWALQPHLYMLALSSVLVKVSSMRVELSAVNNIVIFALTPHESIPIKKRVQRPRYRVVRTA